LEWELTGLPKTMKDKQGREVPFIFEDPNYLDSDTITKILNGLNAGVVKFIKKTGSVTKELSLLEHFESCIQRGLSEEAAIKSTSLKANDFDISEFECFLSLVRDRLEVSKNSSLPQEVYLQKKAETNSNKTKLILPKFSFEQLNEELHSVYGYKDPEKKDRTEADIARLTAALNYVSNEEKDLLKLWIYRLSVAK
jgi:hypothetical protein